MWKWKKRSYEQTPLDLNYQEWHRCPSSDSTFLITHTLLRARVRGEKGRSQRLKEVRLTFIGDGKEGVRILGEYNEPSRKTIRYLVTGGMVDEPKVYGRSRARYGTHGLDVCEPPDIRMLHGFSSYPARFGLLYILAIVGSVRAAEIFRYGTSKDVSIKRIENSEAPDMMTLCGATIGEWDSVSKEQLASLCSVLNIVQQVVDETFPDREISERP